MILLILNYRYLICPDFYQQRLVLEESLKSCFKTSFYGNYHKCLRVLFPTPRISNLIR